MILGTTRTVTVTLLTAMTVSTWGCGDDGETGAGGMSSASTATTAGTQTATTVISASSGTSANTSGSTGSSGLDIVWEPCPLSSDGAPGPMVECATIPVPVDWNDPDGDKIDFFVKRLPASTQPAHRQIWFLNGGPGYSGADYDYMPISQTIDIYLPDHRGTGRSSRLSCPAAEEENTEDGIRIGVGEMPACVEAMKAEWGARLNGFTTTNAAHDVGEVIAATSVPGDAIFVYGGSYGSALANRYLLLYPDQPTGVILDAPAVVTKVDRFNQWMDSLAQAWAGKCALDATCSGRMGAEPWAVWTQALDDLDAGNCPGIEALGYDRDFLINLWGQFYYSWDLRPLTMPMVHRLARCAPQDVKAYENFLDALVSPPPTAADRYYSTLLSAHISLSELWSEPVQTVADIEAFRATAHAGHHLPALYASTYDAWPRYPKDAFADVLAPSDKPVLTMHGELDFIPAADAEVVGAHFSGPMQTYLEIPNAPHATFGAPSADGGPTCAQLVFRQFLLDPTSVIDTSCTANVAAIDFSIPSADSSAFFGTVDPWDGIPPGTATAGPPPSPAFVEARMREARYRITDVQRLRSALGRALAGRPHL